jgi:hypothetical protein
LIPNLFDKIPIILLPSINSIKIPLVWVYLTAIAANYLGWRRNLGFIVFVSDTKRLLELVRIATMGSSFPSFQSFYQQEIPRDADCPQHHQHDTSDGFTGQEVSSALDPISQSWSPFRPYIKLPISLLKTGSGRWEITGRIVNFTRPGTRLVSTQQQYLILLSDDSGVISVSIPTYHKRPS